VHIWETNNSKTFEHIAEVKPKDGAFTLTFEPDSIYSLTTTTGQGKGNAQLPAQKPFPMPYADDFESGQPGHAPRYLSDQDGAFEVQPCVGRSGRCLGQVITERPIPWGPLPDPFTIAGDVLWTDYEVAADFMLNNSGAATVMGRIDSSDVFQDGDAIYPSAYVLSVQSDGGWNLLSATYKKPPISLASGSVSLSPGSGIALHWPSMEDRLPPRSMEFSWQKSLIARTRMGCLLLEQDGTKCNSTTSPSHDSFR